MPAFRDDHILIISPGSLNTLAQLGLPESFTPAKLRVPSRMFPGIEEGTWTPTKVRELREEENLESFLGGKIERKRQRGVVKKDVVVGNGAPPTAVKSASPKQEDEKPKEEGSATPAGKGKSPEAGGTGMDAPAGASSVDTPGQKNSASGQDPDLDLPDVDDNDEDDEEGEEGEELEEGEEPEGELEGDIGETQEGDGDQVEEIVVSDDEDMAEGEEIVEDIIEFGEESGEKGGVMYVEDEDDEEGAVFPIQKGKVTDWGCFFALLTHVHELINPTFHTPILIVCPPLFTPNDKELLTQFVFEKLKAPGLCLLDSAMAVNWAYGVGNSLVVDIGFEKTDITPVLDFIICEAERDTIPIGGEDMTQHLSKILGGEEKGWGRDATEQLKCSPICEIMDLTKYPIAGTIAADAADPLRKTKISAGAPLEEDEEEGITNVAAIVASGKTHEYLAKKEKERQEAQRGAQKNLPNWRREYNKFWLIEKRKDGDVVMADDWEEDKKIDDHEDERASENGRDEQPRLEQPPLPDHQTNPDDTASNITVPTIPGGEPVPQNTETAADSPSTTPPPAPISTPKTAEEIEAEVRSAREREEARMKEKEKRREEKRAKVAESSLGPNEVRKEVEVGLERFKAAECGILEILADATYRIVSRVHDISRRQELWDSMIIVGNGSKIRGFKENLLNTILEKYKISPSSSTIYSSEIPSAASTPLPTGASTPLPGGSSSTPINPPTASGVNPLLLAATTSNLQFGQQHLSATPTHTQTPANVRLVKMPEYFPEWKDAGFEEANFLGAQVCAKVTFVVDQGANRGFLTRVEYNEHGPPGIHSVVMGA